MVLKCVELFSVLFLTTPLLSGSAMSIYKCNKYPEESFIMNKNKLKKCMMSVLEPIGVLTFNEWWTKTFTKYPELDTAEYGNYFRNAQQELKRDNKVYLNQSKQWIVV